LNTVYLKTIYPNSFIYMRPEHWLCIVIIIIIYNTCVCVCVCVVFMLCVCVVFMLVQCEWVCTGMHVHACIFIILCAYMHVYVHVQLYMYSCNAVLNPSKHLDLFLTQLFVIIILIFINIIITKSCVKNKWRCLDELGTALQECMYNCTCT